MSVDAATELSVSKTEPEARGIRRIVSNREK